MYFPETWHNNDDWQRLSESLYIEVWFEVHNHSESVTELCTFSILTHLFMYETGTDSILYLGVKYL